MYAPIKRLIPFLLLALVLLACHKLRSATTTPTELPQAATSISRPTASPDHKTTPSTKPTSAKTPTATIGPTLDLNPVLVDDLGKGEMPLYIESSPNGRFIFVTRWDYDAFASVSILDATTKEELWSFGLGLFESGLTAYSPDGKLFAINAEGEIKVIDLAADQIIATAQTPEGGCAVYSIIFSPDSRYLIYQDRTTANNFDPEVMQAWDIQKDQLAYLIPSINSDYDIEYPWWQESKTLITPANTEDPVGALSDPASSPDSKLLIAGDSIGRVFVWDLPTGLIRYILRGHAGSISEVTFSPDGRFVASGSFDGTVRLWHVADGSLARVITGFVDGVTAVAFTPDGKQLHIQVSDQPPQAFDMNTAELTPLEEPIVATTPDPYAIELLEEGYLSGSPSFTQDGKTLVLVDDWVISRWNIASKKLSGYWLPPIKATINSISYNPDGHVLAILADGSPSDHHSFAIWDAQADRQIFPSTGMQRFGNHQAWESLEVSGSNAYLAVGGENRIEIWDLLQGQKITEIVLESAENRVTQVSFSADESQLYVILDWNEAFHRYDVQTGRQLDAIEFSPAGGFSAIALHWPWFARSNADQGQNWVELWNLENKAFQKLDVLDYGVEPICFSPDASFLFASTRERQYFWQTDTGQLLHTGNLAFSCYGLSADGKQMAIKNSKGEVELWDSHAILQLAQQPAITPAVLPTPTHDAPSQETATPQPTLALTPQALPSLPAGAISPANAAQVSGIARFGQGTIEQILWSPDQQSVLAVSSQGMHTYEPGTLARLNAQQTQSWLTSAIFTADGRLLAAGKDGSLVQAWDVTNHKLLVETAGQGEPAISPDGKLLVFADSEDNLQVWNVETDQLVVKLHSFASNDRPIFSPDSQLIAAVQFSTYGRVYNQDFYETIRVWEARTGKIVNALGGTNSQITDLSFSDDGKCLVGASGGTAWVWDMDPRVPPYSLTLDEGRKDYTFLLFDKRVTSATLSPDNRILAIGTSQRTIWLYDRRSRGVLRQLEGHSNAPNHLRFSPDGQRLLSTDLDGRLMIWDVASGKLLASQHEHIGALVGMLFGDDGNLHAWEGNTAWVIRPEDAAPVRSTAIYSGTIFAASPDGLRLAVYQPYRASLWNAENGEFELLLEGEPSELPDWRFANTRKDFKLASFSNNSQILIIAGTGGHIYDAAGKLVAEDAYGYPYPRQIVFASDNETIAAFTDSNYGPPTIRSVRSDRVVETDLSSMAASQLAFVPGGRLLGGVATGWDNAPDELIIWMTADGRQVNHLPFPGAHLTSLAFSPNGSVVAIGQDNGKIILVDVATLKVLASLSGHNGSLQYLAFSPDGKTLASAATDGTIRFWSIP